MSAAVFGLVGVIIGGLITGGFQVFLERRREKRAGRVARRLVAVDVYEIWRGARTVLEKGRTPDVKSPDRRFFSTTEWARHRDDLARTLSKDDWLLLAHLMSNIGWLYSYIYDLPASTPIPDWLDVAMIRDWASTTHEALTGETPEQFLGLKEGQPSPE